MVQAGKSVKILERERGDVAPRRFKVILSSRTTDDSNVHRAASKTPPTPFPTSTPQKKQKKNVFRPIAVLSLSPEEPTQRTSTKRRAPRGSNCVIL